MEGLERLVAESLARNGFETPETRVQQPTASAEMRLAASPPETSRRIEPSPLPSGF
jgi:hypothetical protein